MTIKIDENSIEILLGTHEDEADQKLAFQLDMETRAGLRASVLDPPFASLAEQTKTAVAKFGEELGYLTEAYAEWTEMAASYGFAGSHPEKLVAIAILAALRPEIDSPGPNKRELAKWLLEQPIAVRILQRVLSYATCTLEPSDRTAAVERAFIRRVFLDIYDEVQGGV